MNIILIASKGPRVGKTTLSNLLIKENIIDTKISFATPLKEDAFNTLINYSLPPSSFILNFQNISEDFKSEKFLTGHNFRDFIGDYSALISKYVGREVWAKLALETLLKLNLNNCKTIAFDDWRRHNESEYIISNLPDSTFLKIYLEREGLDESKNLQGSAKGFEGLIQPEECDIHFIFKEDYSNLPDLLNLIKFHLNKGSSSDV